MHLDLYVASILIGLVAGLLSGIFGIGGATVVIPLLRIVLGFKGHMAVATALPLTTVASFTGLLNYHAKNLVKYRTAIFCGVIGGIFSILGAILTVGFDDVILMLLLSIFLIIIGLRAFLYVIETSEKSEKKLFEKKEKLFPIGAISGFISGFFGIGGGVVLVPLLMKLGKVPFKKAAATSLAAMLIYTIPGVITHYVIGNVELITLGLLAIGAVSGAFLGSRFAIKTEGKELRRAFGGLLLILGLMLLINELHILGYF